VELAGPEAAGVSSESLEAAKVHHRHCPQPYQSKEQTGCQLRQLHYMPILKSMIVMDFDESRIGAFLAF
jgi:hypothetical protein